MMSPDRLPMLNYAVDAHVLAGGQGLNFSHVAEIARGGFRVKLFGRGVDGEDYQAIPESRLANFLTRIPVLRRNRHWKVLWQSRHFDRMVADRLTGGEVFLGAGGTCLRSFAAAHALGSRRVLDVTTLHVDQFGGYQDREGAKFDVRASWHKALRDQAREEYRQADLIRIVSHLGARSLVEGGVDPDKIVVVHPPLLSMEEFPNVVHESDRLRIGIVGMLEPAKGFHYLVEAVQGIRSDDLELSLWGGTGSRKIAQYVAKATSQDPRIKHRTEAIRAVGLESVFGNMEVLVHPSLSDGFGLAVAEAMACGIPAIVTSTTGASDLIEDGVSGFIVPPADAGAIRDRLRFFLDNPGSLSRMGAAARAAVSQLTLDQSRAAFLPRLHALL